MSVWRQSSERERERGMASENVKALYDYNASEKDELSFKYVLFFQFFCFFRFRKRIVFDTAAHAETAM